jgi:hypothetical protein
MAKKKFPPEVEDAVEEMIEEEMAGPQPEPSKLPEQFDELLAGEMAKAGMPREPRMTAPFNLALMISLAMTELPEGLHVKYQLDQERSFLAEAAGEDVDYLFSADIAADSREILSAGIDMAIRGASTPFEHDGVEVYLHAVQGHRDVRRTPEDQSKYSVHLTYIFRVRLIPGNKEA